MSARSLLIAACLVVANSQSGDEKTVKLTVFYESYCPYSIQFIENQLYPTWKNFTEYIKLDLVPFGNAKKQYVDGHWQFKCQHGRKECEGNMLHACAIHEACGGGTLECPADRLAHALEYIHCSLKQKNQKEASDQCAVAADLDQKNVSTCASSRQGETLLSQYGNQTQAFNNPPISYVPYIVFNGKHSEEEQKEANYDLTAVICKRLQLPIQTCIPYV